MVERFVSCSSEFWATIGTGTGGGGGEEWFEGPSECAGLEQEDVVLRDRWIRLTNENGDFSGYAQCARICGLRKRW